MDKVTKFLKKRTKTEQKMLVLIMQLIIQNKLANLDIKKLKGEKSLFRVRIGNFRIIFNRVNNNNQIIKIDQRNNQTYKN